MRRKTFLAWRPAEREPRRGRTAEIAGDGAEKDGMPPAATRFGSADGHRRRPKRTPRRLRRPQGWTPLDVARCRTRFGAFDKAGPPMRQEPICPVLRHVMGLPGGRTRGQPGNAKTTGASRRGRFCFLPQKEPGPKKENPASSKEAAGFSQGSTTGQEPRMETIKRLGGPRGAPTRASGQLSM